MSIARRRGLQVWALGAALFLALLAARGQWSSGIWPSKDNARVADPIRTATNIWATWITETVTATRSNEVRRFTNHYLRNVVTDRLLAESNSAPPGAEWSTNSFGEDVLTNAWVSLDLEYLNVIHRRWHQTNFALPLQAKDRAAWEAYMAQAERHRACYGPGLVPRTNFSGPAFYRQNRDALVAAKAWIQAAAPLFVMVPPGGQSLAAWSEANPASNFPPMWSAASLLDRSGLPSNWFSSTRWRELYGEGTNTLQWDGVKKCLDLMVWTAGEAYWTGGGSTGWYSRMYGEYEVHPSWDEALEFAASNHSSGSDSAPGAWSVGSYENGFTTEGNPIMGYVAQHGAAWAWLATGVVMAATSACAVDVYVRASAAGPGASVLDYNGDTAIETGKWSVAETLTPNSTGCYVSATQYGHPTLSKPHITETPAPLSGRGYRLSNPAIVIRHDVSGGLKFVP